MSKHGIKLPCRRWSCAAIDDDAPSAWGYRNGVATVSAWVSVWEEGEVSGLDKLAGAAFALGGKRRELKRS